MGIIPAEMLWEGERVMENILPLASEVEERPGRVFHSKGWKVKKR